ncbi:MAG: DUF4276 family protein [Chloroflexi bacterium]|nr:DUF4276 family protein [Chloroflexota bacterium]
MRIALLVEGKTETAFLPHLRGYLQARLAGKMPKLDPVPYDGRIPTGAKLRRIVEQLLNDAREPADHVIALTDVYTGTQPPEFKTAADAKRKMREWVGAEDRFHPHVAVHDFEAWLLPYWPVIQKLAGHNRAAPSGNPEAVNHNNPPAYRIREIFRIGECRDDYVKPRDAHRILTAVDLSVAISQCPELKALVNTTIRACGGAEIS